MTAVRWKILLTSTFLIACASERDSGTSFEVQPQGKAGSSPSAGAAGDTGAAGTTGEEAGAAGAQPSEGGSAGNSGGAGLSGNSGQSPGGEAGQAGESGEGGAAGDAGTAGGSAGNGGSANAGTGGSSAGASGSTTGQGGKAGASGGTSGAAGSEAGGTGGAGGGSSGTGGSGGTGGNMSLCPDEMAWVTDGFCVDRWEAQVEVEESGVWNLHSPYEVLDDVTGSTRAISSPGVVPQGYISGLQARAACEGAGKRLCTRIEFRRACQGPDENTYPYGNDYQKGACNEGREVHPIVELFGTGPGVFNSTNMNDPAVNQLPDSLAPTGSYSQCESAEGAFDMSGNLHEWVDEDEGTFCGGFYVDAKINGPGCLYTTTAHAISYHDYSTGFRCCLTP